MLRRLAFLLAILVAVRALAPAFGYLVLLEKHVEKVARMFEKGEAATVRFAFSKAEKGQLKWVKKGREFVRDGQLFDVEKMEIRGDSFVVFAHFDKFETDLHTAFSAQKTSDERDFSSGFLVEFYASPFEVSEYSIFCFYHFWNRKSVFFYLKKAFFNFSELESPPPKSSVFS